jgi:hypothetical protein
MSTPKENLLIFGATGYIGIYTRSNFQVQTLIWPNGYLHLVHHCRNKVAHLEKLKELVMEIITGDVTKIRGCVDAV